MGSLFKLINAQERENTVFVSQSPFKRLPAALEICLSIVKTYPVLL
jgi:hypothetical protein